MSTVRHMMNCNDLHRSLRGNGTIDAAAVEAHLERCAACRSLAADNGALATALDAAAPQTDLDIAGLESTIIAQASNESGLIARARSLSSLWRLALAGLVALGIAGSQLILMPRPDMGVYPPSRMAVILLTLTASVMAAALASLRPLHRPPLPAAVRNGLVAVLLVLPWIVSGMPPAHIDHAASLGGVGDALITKAVPCFVFGVATGIPFVLSLWLLDRGGHRGFGRTLLAAAGAGLVGMLALQLHCPLTAPAHLLAGHATAALAMAGGYAIVRWLGQRLTS